MRKLAVLLIALLGLALLVGGCGDDDDGESAPRRPPPPLAANAAAHEIYMARLREPEAEAARAYLSERKFDAAAAAQLVFG
ncbi:hypothetical protein [Nocardia cyriacigeorgica]|uniref:hypothetical protein n=1 Tax=Nocardia cyriacigeorgica TaxID=135487 RepID=UPI002455A8B1|nr:hypothetical protein [Nocardia cyriacigeorgica]